MGARESRRRGTWPLPNRGSHLASATQLDRLLWLSTGLDIGLILAGITLASTAWIVGRRPGAIGAGIGVLVQAAGLLVLDLRFVSVTARIF